MRLFTSHLRRVVPDPAVVPVELGDLRELRERPAQLVARERRAREPRRPLETRRPRRTGSAAARCRTPPLRPCVGSHRSRSASGGSLKPRPPVLLVAACGCRRRRARPSSATAAAAGTPSENWCTYGLTKSRFEKLGSAAEERLQPERRARAPAAMPCENGFDERVGRGAVAVERRDRAASGCRSRSTRTMPTTLR